MSRPLALTLVCVAAFFVGCGDESAGVGFGPGTAGVGSVHDTMANVPDSSGSVTEPDASSSSSDAVAVVCGAVAEVAVTGGDALTRPWSDLRLEGQGFEAYEGREVHLSVVSSLGPLDLTGQGKAVVACGGFVFHASEVLEYGVYKNIALYVDEDGDGVCDDGVDTVWSKSTSAIGGDVEVFVSATDPIWQGGNCRQPF